MIDAANTGAQKLKRWSLHGDLIRFLVAGGLNTLLTLAVYQALLFAASPGIAYAIAWVVGILFVMIVYPSRVFPEGRTGMLDRVLLGCFYAVVFLLGLLLLNLLNSAKLHPRLSIFLVMAFTTGVGFIVSRTLLRRTIK